MSESSSKLTDFQRNLICSMLQVGCDRAAAARTAGVSLQQLRDEMQRDTEYAKELLKAEGKAELHRMKTLHNASAEEKYWRAATWWIERKTKKRLARRQAKKMTSIDMHDFLAELEVIVFAEMARQDERDRLLIRLCELANAMDTANDTPEENQEP